MPLARNRRSSTWTLLDGIETFMQLDASGAYPVNEK